MVAEGNNSRCPRPERGDRPGSPDRRPLAAGNVRAFASATPPLIVPRFSAEGIDDVCTKRAGTACDADGRVARMARMAGKREFDVVGDVNPATAPARLQELLQINGRLTAERDALLAALGTLDESRSKVAELQAVAQAAECARDEAAQRLAAILRESEAAQRKLDDARSEAVARAAEAETHVAARDMARTELQELKQKIHETKQRLAQLQAGLAEVQDAIAGREAAEQARDGAAAALAAPRHDVDAARRDLDDAISQASARRGEAAEHLAAGEQVRAELLAVREQMRAETRALNEQETRLATARATASGLQAAGQAG